MDPNQDGRELQPEDCLNGASGRLDQPQVQRAIISIGSPFAVFQLFRQYQRPQRSNHYQLFEDSAAATIASSLSSTTSSYVTEAASSAVTESIAQANASTIYSTAGATNGLTIAHEQATPLEALSERWQYFIVALYSLTAITSFILNVVTVIVLARCRRSKLRKYLINLSMSDLLLSLFSIPFTYTEYMLGRWIFPWFMCPVVRSVVTLSLFVSVTTMTVIGINRHLAIMHPFKREVNSKFRKWTSKTHVILLIWLIGIIISAPEYIVNKIKPFCYQRQYQFQCKHLRNLTFADQYTIFIYVSTFIFPFLLLCSLYTSIGLKLWRHRTPGNADVDRETFMHSMRIKVVKMLLVVVILFALFWLPLQTFSMFVYVFPDLTKEYDYPSLKYDIFVGTYLFCHWLSTAHSCMNPLIYCFMNEKFRSDFYYLICKRPCHCTKSGYQNSEKSLQRQYSLVYLSSGSLHQSSASADNGQLHSHQSMTTHDSDFGTTDSANGEPRRLIALARATAAAASINNNSITVNKGNGISFSFRRRAKDGTNDSHQRREQSGLAKLSRRLPLKRSRRRESTFQVRSSFGWPTSSFSNNNSSRTGSTVVSYTDASTNLERHELTKSSGKLIARAVSFDDDDDDDDGDDDDGEEESASQEEDSYYSDETDELAGQPARSTNL